MTARHIIKALRWLASSPGAAAVGIVAAAVLELLAR